MAGTQTGVDAHEVLTLCDLIIHGRPEHAGNIRDKAQQLRLSAESVLLDAGSATAALAGANIETAPLQ